MKWPEASFAKIAEIVTGNTPPKKDPSNYGLGVPWVKPPDLDGWEPITATAEYLSPKGQKLARLLPEGTILVCCIGSIGRVGIAGTTLATNQQINSLVFGPLVEPRFGYYYCRLSPQVLQAEARNAVVPILNKSNFGKIKMPLPPLSEQRRIVEILDQADVLRKKRAEADAKAARILPALFYKMFGDPATNPKGWPLVPFGDIVEIGTRLVDPNQDEYLNLPHIGGEQIEGNSGRILNFKKVRESNLRSGKFIFSEQHVLYSKIRPYLNKVAFPRFSGVCSADIYPLLPRDQRVSPWYIVALLQTRAFLSYAAVHSGRLRIPKLNQEQLSAFKSPLPDTNLIVDFERRASKIDQVLDSLTVQSNNVARLFSILLHRAFTGDLTAKWREGHMKELLTEMEIQAKALALNE